MKKFLFVVFICQFAFSQSVEIEEVIQNFDGAKNWQIPISRKQTTQGIAWQERISSFSSEGIKTFVGYADNQLVSVISIYKNQIAGSVSWKGKNYQISTKNSKIIIREDKSKGGCGTCDGVHCSPEEHSHEEHSISARTKRPLDINQNEFTETPEIYSDGILRVYRLAVLVDYSAYTSWFHSDVIRVKSFLSEVETFMNEVYKRDIGVKFVLVNDEKLIRKEANQEVFKYSERGRKDGGAFVSSIGTSRITDLIGIENYDTGITICVTGSSYNGLADVNLAHSQKRKASAWSKNIVTTVAHELGHLFGSLHTFTKGGELTIKTEPGYGNSLMSYGHNTPRDFFSLPSVNYIRQSMLVNAPGYFADREHTQKVGVHRQNGNAVFGIDTKNKAPKIDRSKIKKEYRLPQETYFQFDIKATDPEGDKLLYMAHQADIIEYGTSKANFISRKASPNSVVPFLPEYEIRNGNSTAQIPYTSVYQDTRGEFTFWIGVNDAGILLENPNADHATQYDMVETKVKIENGTPFKITEGILGGINAPTYSAGQKVTLKWGVDSSFFDANSKVKISLSDDFGKTYKYVILAETPNDGEEEITLPNIEIGDYTHSPQLKKAAGILKIEVLDHIAVALTETDPILGGFNIKKSQITLENLPSEQNISVKGNQLPEKQVVTAKSSCNSDRNPQVHFEEKINGNIVERIWKSTDLCGNTAFFTQFITKENEVTPLEFVNPPADAQFDCLKDIPEAKLLEIRGVTNATQTFSQSKVKMNTSGTGLIIKRIWTAKDDNEQSISHTQTILVYDNIPPTLSSLPENKTVKHFNDIRPLVPHITASDNCGNTPNLQLGEGYKDDDAQGRTRYYYSWLATDESGNQTYHEQIFTIDPNYVAPTTPVLSWVENSLPKNTKVSCENIPVIATNLQANGGCSTLTISHKSDEISAKICTNSYKITRIYEAKDTCGNSKMHTQIIEVEDVTKPTFVGTLPQNIEIFEDENIPAQENLTTTDNCGTATVTKTETRESGKVTYIWTAKDDCGNQVVHTQIITIKPRPVQPIVWVENSLPKNENYTCRASVPAKSTDNLRVTGGQGNVKFAVSESVENEQCTNKVTIKRIFTASENSMQLTHTQIITVNDNEKPTFVGTLPQNIEIFEDENIPAQENLTATDNCGTATVIKTESRESGKVTYIWTAKDDCGNQVVHTQIITIKPRPIQPIVWVENSLPKNENYTCRASVPAKSTDNLRVTGGQGNVKFAVSESVENEQCTNKVTIKRIFTASENSMQLAHTQIITVNDNEKPTFVGTLPQNIEIFEGENIPAQENLTATDNCGTATVTKTESRENGKVTYIWTAKDDCGNEVVHTQIITLKKKENSEVPKNPEIPKNPNPSKNSAEMVIYNAISTENGSENYFRIENLSENSVVRVQIFSNLGEKVYESDAYGQNNMFFRGYSNVKDISNTEKLPEGVYYYLLWINNEPKPRKGYLYVR